MTDAHHLGPAVLGQGRHVRRRSQVPHDPPRAGQCGRVGRVLGQHFVVEVERRLLVLDAARVVERVGLGSCCSICWACETLMLPEEAWPGWRACTKWTTRITTPATMSRQEATMPTLRHIAIGGRVATSASIRPRAEPPARPTASASRPLARGPSAASSASHLGQTGRVPRHEEVVVLVGEVARLVLAAGVVERAAQEVLFVGEIPALVA